VSIYDQGKPGHGYVECRWAILVSRPSGRKLRDFIPMTMDDGVTPLTFATEAEARAAATGPQHGPFMARIEDPWRIAMVYEPYPPLWRDEPEVRVKRARQTGPDGARGSSAVARQTGAGVPHDLLAVYENLVPMIHAKCRDLAAISNPVMFMFIDTCGSQVPTSSRDVSADIARALWTEGLQELRDLADAALDPSSRLDVESRLGLERGFFPNLAVLVYQYWHVHEVIDGRLQTRHSYEPRVGVPHRLQVELRAHGCAPVIVGWKVLQREGSACAVPPPPRHFVGPVDLAPPSLPTAAARAAVDRAVAEISHRQNEEAEAMFASKLPTFFVRSPPLSRGRSLRFRLSDPVLVTFRAGDANDVLPDPVGSVTLQTVNGLVVPTDYSLDSETYRFETFWPRGTAMVVYSGYRPAFKIVVIQPLQAVPSGR